MESNKIPQPVVLQNGQSFSRGKQPDTFPVGTKFMLTNEQYSDLFRVTDARRDGGTDYRVLEGRLSGEVVMQLGILQREAAKDKLRLVVDPPAIQPGLSPEAQAILAREAAKKEKAAKRAPKKTNKKPAKKTAKKSSKKASKRSKKSAR
jgi:hypothetical protein